MSGVSPSQIWLLKAGVAGGPRRVEIEPDDFSLRAAGERAGIRLGGVEDGEAIGGLRFDETGLGINVAGHGLMTVQMIGCDVKDQRDFGLECLNLFQLKAGKFQDDRGIGRGLRDQVRDGDADVAADKRGATRVLEDVADKGGGGGLAICAGYADDVALQLLRGEF